MFNSGEHSYDASTTWNGEECSSILLKKSTRQSALFPRSILDRWDLKRNSHNEKYGSANNHFMRTRKDSAVCLFLQIKQTEARASGANDAILTKRHWLSTVRETSRSGPTQRGESERLDDTKGDPRY